MSRTLKVSSSAVAKTFKCYNETGSHEDRHRKGWTNNKKRLAWAKKHEQWTLEWWKSVLWSDESKFEMFGSNPVTLGDTE